jgi:hypothetical protein
MTAPERFAETSDSSCTAGAVHTWHLRHTNEHRECLLSRVFRKSSFRVVRAGFDPTETWRAPCVWRPLPASIAVGARARPDPPISGHRGMPRRRGRPDTGDGRYILIGRARNSDIRVFPKSTDPIQPDCSARPLSSPVVPLPLASSAVSMCHSSASGKLLGWRTLRTA